MRRREFLYKDEEIYLEKIELPVVWRQVNERKVIWRQVTNINGELEVKESYREPDWYTRHKKLEFIK
jgi:hypothetical protein